MEQQSARSAAKRQGSRRLLFDNQRETPFSEEICERIRRVNAEIELNEKRKKRKLSKAAARELSFPSNEVTSISFGAASYYGRNLLHSERAADHRWQRAHAVKDQVEVLRKMKTYCVEIYWNVCSTCLVVVILNSYVFCHCCLAATRSRGVSRGERRGEG